MKVKRVKAQWIFRLIRWAGRRLWYSLKHLRGEPQQIAWGGAIGVFVSVTPTFGLQLIIAYAIASLFRVNRLIAVSLSWISNIFTVIPIYYFTYRIGKAALGGRVGGYEEFAQMEWTLSNWAGIYKFFLKHWGAMWLGAAIIGLAGGAVTFIVLYYTTIYFRRLREKKFQKRFAKSERNPDTAADS